MDPVQSKLSLHVFVCHNLFHSQPYLLPALWNLLTVEGDFMVVADILACYFAALVMLLRLKNKAI